MRRTFDYVLIGGGLQNGLIALAVRARRPDSTIAMVERRPAPGGNHTWCFHAGGALPAWLAPLVEVQWDGYDVAFPAYRRTLAAPYACVTSRRFAEHVAPHVELFANTTAMDVDADTVRVRDLAGRVRELAGTVIDARGPDRAAVGACGWQKFVGQELRLAAPHGLERPILMDATVPQRDGFRFFYVLPLAADRVLVEDTYFSSGTFLDAERLRADIAAYVAARGWAITEHVREETGLLPLPWRCEPPRVTAPLVAGYAGGWFHPVTGYSFPIAVRLAEAIAAGDPLGELAAGHARQLRYALRLNKMLFRWFPPGERYRVLERFYRLPERVIGNFYALQLTALDRARILFGRPPRGLSLRGTLGLEAS